MSQLLPKELSVILISRNDSNYLLQVEYEKGKNATLAWRSPNGAVAWVEAGGIKTEAEEKLAGSTYKMSFRLPDGSTRPIGEIRYFTFSTNELKEMSPVVYLEPASGSVKGTLVRL